MPRNAAGIYSLPAGNPVVTATVISSVWANTTLSDIGTEITDSLDRSGKGAMLAPLQLFAGAVGAPGLTWGAETTSGLYRAAAGDFRYAIGGVDVLFIGAGGASSTVFLAGNGTAAAPSFSFISDPDTGMYRIGANNIGVSVGNSKVLDLVQNTVSVTGISIGIPIVIGDMTALPNNSTAIYIADIGAAISGVNGDLGLIPRSSTVGSVRVYTGNGGLVTQKFAIENAGNATFSDGTVGVPGIGFISDPDTGFYRAGSGGIIYSSNGAISIQLLGNATRFGDGFASGDRLVLMNNVARSAANLEFYFNYAPTALRLYAYDGAVTTLGIFQIDPQLRTQDGSVGNPGITFTTDPDTGFYRFGVNEFRAVVAGAPAASFFDNAGQAQFLVVDGVVGKPGFSFINDPDTGIYRIGANNIGIACGGTIVLNLNAANLTTTLVVNAGVGAAGGPSYSFNTDTNTGMYGNGADQINFATNGVLRAFISNTVISSAIPFGLPGFTVAGLPAGVVGMLAYVTNALAPAYGAVVAGGGAVVTTVFFNGVNWITV